MNVRFSVLYELNETRTAWATSYSPVAPGVVVTRLEGLNGAPPVNHQL